MAKEIYPFGEYMKEDLSHYPLAREKGYIDPYDMFRVGDSGGFLMNFRKGRFVNTHLFCEMANIFQKEGKYTNFKKIVFLIDNFVSVKHIAVIMVIVPHVGKILMEQLKIFIFLVIIIIS